MTSSMCLSWGRWSASPSGVPKAGSAVRLHVMAPSERTIGCRLQALLHVLTNRCSTRTGGCPAPPLRQSCCSCVGILPLQIPAIRGCAGQMGARTAAGTGSVTGTRTGSGVGTAIGTSKGSARGSAPVAKTATAATGAGTGFCLSFPSTALAQQSLPFPGVQHTSGAAPHEALLQGWIHAPSPSMGL